MYTLRVASTNNKCCCSSNIQLTEPRIKCLCTSCHSLEFQMDMQSTYMYYDISSIRFVFVTVDLAKVISIQWHSLCTIFIEFHFNFYVISNVWTIHIVRWHNVIATRATAEGEHHRQRNKANVLSHSRARIIFFFFFEMVNAVVRWYSCDENLSENIYPGCACACLISKRELCIYFVRFGLSATNHHHRSHATNSVFFLLLFIDPPVIAWFGRVNVFFSFSLFLFFFLFCPRNLRAIFLFSYK